MPIISCPNGNKIIIDDTDYEKAKDYTWLAYNYENDDARIFTLINKKRHSMSKLIFGIEKGQCIYRKNGNPFDFRRENIIICKNKSEFAQLSFPRVNKTSKYNNVYWDRKGEVWIVAVRVEKKIYHGGRFHDEYDAAIVADFLIFKYYGNSITRNFPGLTSSDINEIHDEVLKKHGQTPEEKYAKAHQGISSAPCRQITKFVGVVWHKRHKYWVAQISYQKKACRKGGFKSDIEAAKAYDEMALELYGTHARLNFI